MKKFAYLTLTLVLTAALLVGCGCTRRRVENTTAPTVLPTNEEVWDATGATTHATTEATAPATADILPGDTNETINHGNGPLEDTTTATGTTENTVEGRARNAMPSGR